MNKGWDEGWGATGYRGWRLESGRVVSEESACPFASPVSLWEGGEGWAGEVVLAVWPLPPGLSGLPFREEKADFNLTPSPGLA